jgi:hypothetical protein
MYKHDVCLLFISVPAIPRTFYSLSLYTRPVGVSAVPYLFLGFMGSAAFINFQSFYIGCLSAPYEHFLNSFAVVLAPHTCKDLGET